MNISFKWIGGATWVLNFNGLKIACDPVLCPEGTVQDYFWFKSLRYEGPNYTDEDFRDIDLWLITHNHEDHLDEQGIRKIAPNSQIITHQNAEQHLRDHKLENISTLTWGKTLSMSLRDVDISIEAIPAVHGVNPVTAFLAGGVNGYLLTLTQGEFSYRVYVTSDTVLKKKVTSHIKNKDVDLLIPNMGAAKKGSWLMTLTLSSTMLQKLVKLLKPETTIPVHFGTFEHYVEPISKVKEWCDDSMIILKPGESFELLQEKQGAILHQTG